MAEEDVIARELTVGPDTVVAPTPSIEIVTTPTPLENGLPSPSQSPQQSRVVHHLEVDSDELYSNPSRPLTPVEPSVPAAASNSGSRPESPVTGGIGSYFVALALPTGPAISRPPVHIIMGTPA